MKTKKRPFCFCCHYLISVTWTFSHSLIIISRYHSRIPYTKNVNETKKTHLFVDSGLSGGKKVWNGWLVGVTHYHHRHRHFFVVCGYI